MGVRLYIRKLMIRLRFAHLRKIWESKRTGPAYIESDAEASRPYYGEAVKLPYLYFPVIIKDVGVIRPEEKLPEADFYVLVCGGKWWEIDRTVNAAKILKSRGNVILLFNHMEKKARLKLPKVLSDIHYFFLPFFSNPFREDKAANTCYRDLWNDGTGETRWKRKKLSQRIRRSDAE